MCAACTHAACVLHARTLQTSRSRGARSCSILTSRATRQPRAAQAAMGARILRQRATTLMPTTLMRMTQMLMTRPRGWRGVRCQTSTAAAMRTCSLCRQGMCMCRACAGHVHGHCMCMGTARALHVHRVHAACAPRAPRAPRACPHSLSACTLLRTVQAGLQHMQFVAGPQQSKPFFLVRPPSTPRPHDASAVHAPLRAALLRGARTGTCIAPC